MDKRRPPWREPMVWLIVALPLASVVGTVGLITAAVRSGGGDAVADPVRRVAQIQLSDLSPDTQARQRGLSAVVRVDAGRVEVFPTSGDFDPAAPLHLSLRHPARADADLLLQLQPTDTGWRARAAPDAGHDWNLQLAPADGTWRITGRLPKGQRATRLAPALAAP